MLWQRHLPLTDEQKATWNTKINELATQATQHYTRQRRSEPQRSTTAQQRSTDRRHDESVTKGEANHESPADAGGLDACARARAQCQHFSSSFSLLERFLSAIVQVEKEEAGIGGGGDKSGRGHILLCCHTTALLRSHNTLLLGSLAGAFLTFSFDRASAVIPASPAAPAKGPVIAIPEQADNTPPDS